MDFCFGSKTAFGQVRKFGDEIAPPYSGSQPCRVNVTHQWRSTSVASGASDYMRLLEIIVYITKGLFFEH